MHVHAHTLHTHTHFHTLRNRKGNQSEKIPSGIVTWQDSWSSVDRAQRARSAGPHPDSEKTASFIHSLLRSGYLESARCQLLL